MLRILKDSRIGAFGALALILALLLKVSLLIDLGVWAPIGLLLGQSISRSVPVVQLGFQSYARRNDEQSKSRDVARSGRVQAVIAGLWGLLFLGIGLYFCISIHEAIAILVAILLISVSFGWYVQRRVGGLTGDFMGTLQQLSELGMLFALVSV